MELHRVKYRYKKGCPRNSKGLGRTCEGGITTQAEVMSHWEVPTIDIHIILKPVVHEEWEKFNWVMEDFEDWLRHMPIWRRIFVESKGDDKTGRTYARERKKHYLKFAVTAKWDTEILTYSEAKKKWKETEVEIRQKIKALCDEYGLELYDNSNHRLGS